MLNLKGDTYGDAGGSEAVKTDRSFTSCLSNELFLVNQGSFEPPQVSNLRTTQGGAGVAGNAAPAVASEGIFVESRCSRNGKKVGVCIYSYVNNASCNKVRPTAATSDVRSTWPGNSGIAKQRRTTRVT